MSWGSFICPLPPRSLEELTPSLLRLAAPTAVLLVELPRYKQRVGGAAHFLTPPPPPNYK